MKYINGSIIGEIIFLVKYTANFYRDFLRGFFCNIHGKSAVRITKEPYIPQRERLCMLYGNPLNRTYF